MTLDVYKKYELPAGWEWKKLGEICNVSDRDHRTPIYVDDGVPLISPRDFTEHGIDLSRLKKVAPSELVAFEKKCKPQKGDILYSRIGTIGEARLHNLDFDFVALHSIALVKPIEPGLDSKFVLYLLQTQAVRSQAKHNIKSVGTPDLGLKRIKEFDVPLAPPDQQKRIVAEIEKQFSRLDEAVANLKRVKANLKRYKAAVLKSAVEGRLVETEAELARREGRSYETGAQLLQRILETRRSQWQGKGKYKEPAEPDTADLPDLPEGWVWASLDQLSWGSGYGTSTKCAYENEGPPVLRIPNVDKAAIDLSDVKYAPVDFHVGEDEALLPGDMLVIRTNGSKSLIGRAAIVTTPFQQSTTYASYLIRFRLTGDESLSAWVLSYWQSHSSRLWIESKAATSAGQHNISMSVLATAPVPVPPAEEQPRIVAEVDRRLSILGSTESQAEVNLQRSERLRQAILAKAFSGHLVNQSIPREAIAASVGKR